MHALGALDGSVASDWRGRGGVHAEARAGLARGIGHGGQHEAGGEVMEQEVVGGSLPQSGIHGGQWRCPGAAWCGWVGLCGVGSI
jgi:hypothetical protein